MHLFPPDQPLHDNNSNTMRVSRPLASYLTYTLGNDLYIPLTSRCNSKTLPQTRGPNFLLPAPVVASLCRVRDMEQGTQQWTYWCNYLDTQEGSQMLPEPLERISELPGTDKSNQLPAMLTEILSEIEPYLKKNTIQTIVFAGEGEPTLRLEHLLRIVARLKESHGTDLPPLRLTTNGLILSSNMAERLKSSGISKVSVALMTADPKQYQELMDPLDIANGHDRVCQFIAEAVQAGLEVETTGVDRKEVDKTATEALAKKLQVSSDFRWRPHFY